MGFLPEYGLMIDNYSSEPIEIQLDGEPLDFADGKINTFKPESKLTITGIEDSVDMYMATRTHKKSNTGSYWKNRPLSRYTEFFDNFTFTNSLKVYICFTPYKGDWNNNLDVDMNDLFSLARTTPN